MANIKSAKKRILQNQKKTDINKYRRSRIRSGIKSLNDSLAKKKKEGRRACPRADTRATEPASRGPGGWPPKTAGAAPPAALPPIFYPGCVFFCGRCQKFTF